jgi:signal transduction histidine kinase
LNRLIEKTLFLNSNLLKINRVQAEKVLDPQLPEVFGSEDQLQQVFMNFISNTVEALEPKGGGVLRIETSLIKQKGKIRVCFTDTGVGIPPENIPKLFEPFFTTKKNGKGVGLGLSVAYGIVQEHGGLIRVSSEVNQGTTFVVELPLHQESHGSVNPGGVHERNQNPHRR